MFVRLFERELSVTVYVQFLTVIVMESDSFHDLPQSQNARFALVF